MIIVVQMALIGIRCFFDVKLVDDLLQCLGNVLRQEVVPELVPFNHQST